MVTESATTITGGTGTTTITLDDDGATIAGSNPGNAGNLTVKGDTTVEGSTEVQGDLAVRGRSEFDSEVVIRDALRLEGGAGTNFGGNRLQNIGDGVAPFDAVNRRQLDAVQEEARRGVAIAAALDTSLPDPGRNFRVNVGGGYYNGESAIGITGAGRINDQVALYFGLGSDTGFNETAAKVGVSYQW